VSQPIKDALEAGDKKTAQSLLLPLLKEKPTADLWVLASKASHSDEQAIDFLRRALTLDPYHNEANRRLFKLEGAKPLAEQKKEQIQKQTQELAQAKKEELPPLKKVRRKRPNWARRILTLLGIFLLGSSCSLLTLNLIGVVSGPITALTIITGGPQPVNEVQGVPIERVEDAPMRVEASQSEPALQRDTDMLDHGYMHEYTFNGTSGRTMVIYVQFLSLTANRVSRNVAIVNPNGQNIVSSCQRDSILQGDNNVAYTCDLNQTGAYAVRVLGRRNESVGAYFIGVEEIEGF